MTTTVPPTTTMTEKKEEVPKVEEDVEFSTMLHHVAIDIQNTKLPEIVEKFKGDPEAHGVMKTFVRKNFESLKERESIMNKKFEEDMVPIQEALVSCQVKEEDIANMKKESLLRYSNKSFIMQNMKALANSVITEKKRKVEEESKDTKRAKTESVQNNAKPQTAQSAQVESNLSKRLHEMQDSISKNVNACVF